MKKVCDVEGGSERTVQWFVCEGYILLFRVKALVLLAFQANDLRSLGII